MDNIAGNAPDTSRFVFPHLNDTAFPLLENADPYEYQNDFDYGRWDDSFTKIVLCNVLWDSNYNNVVKFENDQERDAYFDRLNGYKVELRTLFNKPPTSGVIKVPPPYQVSTRYNYMYFDLPIMTSEDEPINYEDTRRTQRYYYFIIDIEYGAPNATTLTIQLDSWTTYINNVDIPYLMLERGHAPMSCVDVDTYLANPIANNTMLLAPDFDYAKGSDIVSKAEFVPVNNGTKYILFATTMNPQQLQTQTYPPSISKTNTPATFANDDSIRKGYQYIVKDYDWGLGDYDYNGMYTESDAFQSANGTIPNNMTMVAVEATNADAMFEYMSNVVPFIYKTIKACFMVDDTMFVKGQQFTFCNTPCYMVLPAQDSLLSAIKLNKDMFNYSENYANITKLYTSPYARIEVTDNNGNTNSFKIENISNLQVRQATSIAFPYIRIQAYLSGINGAGTESYQWTQLNGTTVAKTMFSDDFGEFMWNWDIPTYALYVRAYDDHKASNYPKQYSDRYNAIAEYHKTVGIDNTQRENSVDAANTTKAMTDNSANTEYTNAVNMNATIEGNADRSAATAQTNHVASANTANTNTNNEADNLLNNTALDVARQTQNEASTEQSHSTSTTQTNAINARQTKIDNAVCQAMTDTENWGATITGIANVASSLAGGISSAAGNLGTGNLSGAAGSMFGGGVNAFTSGVTTAVAISKNETVSSNTQLQNAAKANATNEGNDIQNSIANTLLHDIMTMDTYTQEKIANNTASMMRTNASNTRNTEVANAGRTYNTSVTNANATQETGDANALRTRNNATGNASLNQATTIANSTYTRQTGVENAQITLEQKRIANQQLYYSSRLSAPVQYGTTSGDPTLDAFERRGLQVKIRRQSDGNIAQAGDLMLRFGYALNQVWNVANSGLTLMKHFTYWKAQDIWINEGEGVYQGAQADIRQAFENGVTVWSDPEEIGKVSIYDNWN